MENSRLRQPLFGLAAAMLGTAVALGTAEVGAHLIPLNRVQVVGVEQDVVVVDGLPVWHADPVRERPDCSEPAAVLVGSSILFGSGLQAEESIGPSLEEHLGGCVKNLAQPGSTFSNQLALATDSLDGVRTPVLVWEIWRNSVNDFTLVGGDAYNFGMLAPDGSVPNAFHLSTSLNRQLFARSALYRHLDIGWAVAPAAVSIAARWKTLMAQQAPRVRQLAREMGASVLWVLMPRLDRPFAASVGDYPTVTEAAAEAGDPVLEVAGALQGQDVEALRADTCCHYAAAGQRVLAAAVAAEIQRLGLVEH